MANACFNPNDFQTDASGRLELNPAAVQNPAVIFSHTLNGVDGTYEVIPAFPAVVVPRSGFYLVLWDIHGYIALPSPGGPDLQGEVMGAIAINGVFQAGTETMIATLNEGAQGSADEDVPALGQEATGSGSRLFQLTAGQQVRIMGAQDGNGSNDSRIVSNTKGRCRVTLVRLGTAA